MTSDFEKKLLAGAAYRIFFEETHKHMADVGPFFVSSSWSADQLQVAAGRFHTIKGGAGFFQLKGVAAAAGELEGSLKKLSPVEVAVQFDSLRCLYDTLCRAVADMPAPSQG